MSPSEIVSMQAERRDAAGQEETPLQTARVEARLSDLDIHVCLGSTTDATLTGDLRGLGFQGVALFRASGLLRRPTPGTVPDRLWDG
jgi:hypothetical protein